MARLFVTLILFGCISVSAEENIAYKEVVQCSQFPEIQKIEYYLKNSDIKHPEEMRRVIPALMRLDLNEKINAISLVLPKDWRDSEGLPYEMQLSAYNESNYSLQASCLVKYFEVGDNLFRFEKEPTGSYEEGYALFRNKKLIVIVITGGIAI
jgi:hypothetical protein